MGGVIIFQMLLSQFPAIYIPGGQQWTYIPCTLPPGTYNINEVLSISFYDHDPVEDNPIPNPELWIAGDLLSTRYCTGINCNFNTQPPNEAVIASGMYIGDNTWIGDITIGAGLAYVIQTNLEGWFKWTVPAVTLEPEQGEFK